MSGGRERGLLGREHVRVPCYMRAGPKGERGRDVVAQGLSGLDVGLYDFEPWDAPKMGDVGIQGQD